MGANNEKFRIVEENGKFDIQKYLEHMKVADRLKILEETRKMRIF